MSSPRLKREDEVDGPGKKLRSRQNLLKEVEVKNQIQRYDEVKEEWNEFINRKEFGYSEPTADDIVETAMELTRKLFKHDIDSACCVRIKRQPIINCALKELRIRFGKDHPEIITAAVERFKKYKTWAKTELDDDDKPETYRAEKVFRSDIPDDLVEDPEVSDIAVRVYLVMSKVCPNSRHDVSTPIAPATIAERLKRPDGLSISTKTVRRAKENLVKTGWIEIERIKGKPDKTILLEVKQGVQKLDKK